MPCIDIRVVYHCHAIDSIMKSVPHRKCKVGEKKIETIDEEVHKLRRVDFMTEVKYLS